MRTDADPRAQARDPLDATAEHPGGVLGDAARHPAAPAADRYVLIAGHVLFAVLLIIGAVRAAAGGDLTATGTAAPLAVAALTAAWYVAGAVWIAESVTPGPSGDARARVWLAGLLLLWLALVGMSGEFIWLAFLLAMLVWHLLRRRAAAVIAVGVAVVTVVAFAWHQGDVQVGAVLGPVIGIASAVVITEIYQRLRAQSEERRRLLDQLVRTQAALADRERETGRLAERERLARDIHDTVGQSLSSVILLLRAALADTSSVSEETSPPGFQPGSETDETDAAARAHEAHRIQLQTALDGTLAALVETRRLVRGLAPESIEKQGLHTALTTLADETRALGLHASFAEHGRTQPLPRQSEVALLRAAQESVANARTHGAARTVTITLTYHDDEAAVDIVDDGAGFDASAPIGTRADGSGYGLTAMRARMAECGGGVQVESEPGAGTAVRASVPVMQEGRR